MQEKEIRLLGNVALVGFEILEPTEIDSAKKVVLTYLKKFSELGKFGELKLNLQQHAHGKSFKHEISGLAFIGKDRFSASAMEWNVYKAIQEVCEKIYSGVSHKLKKEQRHDKITFR